jgi:hypothetical protein
MGGVALPITTQCGVEAAALQNLADARRGWSVAKRPGGAYAEATAAQGVCAAAPLCRGAWRDMRRPQGRRIHRAKRRASPPN